MRKRNILLIGIIFILVANLFPNVQAAPKAIIYEKEVTASPTVQGRNLPIEVECGAGWGGACCYTVYAHDVQAEIILPENVTLIAGNKIQTMTSSGQSSGTIAVDAGGGLTRLHKIWSIKAEEYGEYNITIIITGENELGEKINESQSTFITITSGASISTPILPRDPTINEDIIVVASVISSDSNVSSVTLYYSMNQENWVSLQMANTQGDTWRGTIPGQKSEEEIYYYMESLDSEGKTFTTEIYSMEVRDITKIGTIAALATYGTLVAFILGLGMIYYINKKGKIPSAKSGLLLLGATLRLSALRGLDEIEDDQERLRKTRMWIALFLLTLMIILLAVAIITGQLQDVISHTTDPEGA